MTKFLTLAQKAAIHHNKDMSSAISEIDRLESRIKNLEKYMQHMLDDLNKCTYLEPKITK